MVQKVSTKSLPKYSLRIEARQKASIASIPVAGNVSGALLIAIAAHRRAGIELLGDAVMHAGEDRGHHQIGIGIGARRTMLDMAGLGRAGRNAQARPCGC